MESINIFRPIIYFIIIYCLTEKYSIEKAFIEVKNNKCLFLDKTCSKNEIMKSYSLLREKIKKKWHRLWNNKKMGNNISPDGYPIFEIDEREIIGNNQVIYWMLCIIDRVNKVSRVYCILNNRKASNLMKMVKDNVVQMKIQTWI